MPRHQQFKGRHSGRKLHQLCYYHFWRSQELPLLSPEYTDNALVFCFLPEGCSGQWPGKGSEVCYQKIRAGGEDCRCRKRPILVPAPRSGSRQTLWKERYTGWVPGWVWTPPTNYNRQTLSTWFLKVTKYANNLKESEYITLTLGLTN